MDVRAINSCAESFFYFFDDSEFLSTFVENLIKELSWKQTKNIPVFHAVLSFDFGE